MKRFDRRRIFGLFLVTLLTVLGAVAGISILSLPPSGNIRTSAATQALPVAKPLPALAPAFEANAGQFDPSIAYLSRTAAYTVMLNGGGATIALAPKPNIPAANIGLRFQGADTQARLEGRDRLPGRIHYLRGSQAASATGVSRYREVIASQLYPGIDAVYRSDAQGRLEYDLYVAAHADPGTIRLAFSGADSVSLDENGDLRIATPAGAITHKKPIATQRIGGERRAVSAAYRLESDRSVTLALGPYDASQPLLIDPVLDYAGTLGGNEDDAGLAVAVDADGNLYVAGSSASSDFPLMAPYQSENRGHDDLFIAKLSPDGTTLDYATYLGGTGNDRATALAVDAQGQVHLAGVTRSADFPLKNAIQTRLGGSKKHGRHAEQEDDDGHDEDVDVGRAAPAVMDGDHEDDDDDEDDDDKPADAFALKLSANGDELLYATYLGGPKADAASALVLNAEGHAYLAGTTRSGKYFSLLTAMAGQNLEKEDAFYLALDAEGRLLHGRRVGGSGDDQASGIALDTQGRILIAGTTASKKDFPRKNAAQSTFGGGDRDAFLLAFMPDAQSLSFSTTLGGKHDDRAYALSVDSRNRILVAGETRSGDFPKTAAVKTRGPGDAFLAAFTADGALDFVQLFGGREQDRAFAIAVGPSDTITIAGDSRSPDFPAQKALQTGLAGMSDAFIARFDKDGKRLFSTLLGGEAVDRAQALAIAPDGRAVIAGSTRSQKTLPRIPPWQPPLAGESDVFLAKLYINGAPQIVSPVLPEAIEHQAYQTRLDVTDPDQDTLTFTLTEGPAGLTLSSGGTVSWPDPQIGSYTLAVSIADTMGEHTDGQFTLSVKSANRPPVFDSAPPLQAFVKQPYHYGLQAHDPDGDAITFELLDAPLGMYLDGQALDWTPVEPGNAAVRVQASDSQGHHTEQAFTIHVAIPGGANRPPELQPIGNRTVLLGTMLKLQLTATDPDGDKLGFGVSPLPLPDGATLDSRSGEFIWKPQVSQAGTWTFTFNVSDGQYTDAETITVIIPDSDPEAPTRLIGRVVDATALAQGIEIPIVASLIRVGENYTLSDAHGDFTLNVPNGKQPFYIDNTNAKPAPDGSGYASFHVDMELIPHADNVMPRPFSLPRIDQTSVTQVDPNTETQVKNPHLGVTLTVAAGSARNKDGTLYTGPLSITEVPRGFTPASMPKEYDPALIVTLQPLGVVFDPPAKISFPNTDQLPSGAEPQLISLNPDTGQFEAVGKLRVRTDQSGLDTFEDGVRQTDWHFWADKPIPKPHLACNCEHSPGADDNSQYGLNDGEMTSGVPLPDTPLQDGGLGSGVPPALEYRSTFAYPNPLVLMQADLGPFTAEPETLSQRFQFGGLVSSGGSTQIHYDAAKLQRPLVRPQGSPVSVWFAMTLQSLVGHSIETTTINSGSYGYSATVTNHYRDSSFGGVVSGRVPLVNAVKSPFGAGWSLSGFTRLHIGEHDVLWETPRGPVRSFQIRTVGGGGGGSTTTVYLSDPQLPPDPQLATLEKSDQDYIRRDKVGNEEHFDADGWLQYRVDRHGNRTTYRYAGSRLVEIIGPTGKSTKLGYNGDKIATITDPANRTTQLRYDAAGNLSTIILPDGSTHRYEYDDRHLLTAHTDPEGHTSRHVYDENGRIKEGRRADGGQIELHYRLKVGLPDGTHAGTPADPLPLPGSDVLEARYTDALKHKTRYTLDNGGHILQSLDALGRTTVYERDLNGNAKKITYPDKTEVKQTFDGWNNLTSHLGPDNILTAFGYNPFSQVTSVTTQAPGAAARSTTFERDPQNGDLQIITDALQHRTFLKHDPKGRTTQIKTPDGQTTDIAYNADGLAETITRTAADASQPKRITTIDYHASGLPKTVTGPDQRSTQYQFDALDRLIAVTDALGQTTQITRDADGLPTRVESRDAQGALVQSQATAYDKRHRTTRSADHDVHNADAPTLAAQFDWDVESNLEQAIDPNRHATSYQYDPVDRLWKSIDALEGVTQLQWDDSDNVTQVTAPNAAATQFKFDDPAHRPTLESSPDRGPVGVGYDADGRLATQTHANGAKLDWSYDALDRLLTETQTLPGQAAVAVRYTYDTCRLGKLCAIDDGTEQIEFAYNGFGQLQTETHSQDGKSVQTGYGYDDAGRVQQLTLPSGRVIHYQRDALGRIVHIAADLNGQPQAMLEQIGYRADGQFDRLRYGNGTVEQRGYDGYGRLSRQTLTASNGPVLQQFDYQRDANGNLTERKSEGLAQFPALTASYRYDSLDRLTQERYDLYSERNADYTFDANGNWLTRQQGVNGTEADEIYSYAAKSNRLLDKDALRQDDATPDPVKDVTYDAKQRVRTLSVDGRLKAEYRYDARNLRTKKTLYDDAGAVSAEVYYHYDANGLLIGESDALGQVRREYVYLGMMPVAQIDIDSQGQESIVYFLTDQLATPRLGIDQSQTVVWKWESDAYGSIAPTGSVTVNLRFAGQYFDAESGWFYNWNRYYLPEEGRYLTSDPIGLGGGINTYAYVKGNPIGFVDSRGLDEYREYLFGMRWVTSGHFIEGATAIKGSPSDPLATAEGAAEFVLLTGGLDYTVGKCILRFFPNYTRLWRAVEAEELADVLKYGDYNIYSNSTFKRFAFDEKSIDDFINANPDRSYTKTYIDIPSYRLDEMYRHPDTGGAGEAIGIDVFERPEFYDWFNKVYIKSTNCNYCNSSH